MSQLGHGCLLLIWVWHQITTYKDVYYHFECVSEAQLTRFANRDGSLSGKIRLHSSLTNVQTVEVKAAIAAAGLATGPEKRALAKKQALAKKLALTKKQAKKIIAAKRFRLRVATHTAGPSQVDSEDSEDIGESENGESELSGTEYDPRA
jgi:hypothetical protein